MANAFESGFLRDTTTHLIACTTDANGAEWEAGFLRSPDGELVVTTDSSGAEWETGFLRAPNGALVVEEDQPGEYASGYVRGSSGALSVTQNSNGSDRAAGFFKDSSGRMVIFGLATTKIAWTGTGATTTVTNLTELNTALGAASAGDTIELADGNYDFTAPIFVNASDIRIKAQNPKGAVLRGSATAPTAANVETTPAHILYGFRVRGDGVYIEDLYFKWFGIGCELDSVDDPVVQGCRFESCFDSAVTVFDVNRPQVHMNEFLDPYLAGDARATLTARGVTDAQMDYGIDIYGCTQPRITHNYFFGVFNQALSFKEGNLDAYAGYNTFEGCTLTALFLGQNDPHNGPYDNTGLANGPEIGSPVLEYNAFRYVDDGGGDIYFMGIPWRIWYVDADVTVRGNVIESSATGPQVQASGTGIAAGTVLIENNVFGGVVGGTQVNQDGGISVNNGVTAVVTVTDNRFSSLPAGTVVVWSDGIAGTPDITETGSTTDSRTTALQAPETTYDPDLSFADQAAVLSYDEEVLADNPVLYWKLDEASGTTAADSSASGLDGTYEGTITYGVAGPTAGETAITLADSGDVVLNTAQGVGAPTSITTGTVEAWINTSDIDANYNAIFVKQNAYAMFIKSGDLISYDYGGVGDRSSGVSVADGTWHLVAFEFESGVAGGSQFYVDGQPAGAAVTMTVGDPAADQFPHVGTDQSAHLYNGSVAKVAIYPTKIGAARHAAHFAAAGN